MLWINQIISFFTSLFELLYATILGTVLAFPQSNISISLSSIQNIGEGAFATVFKAKDIRTRRAYAVKQVLLQSSEQVKIAQVELESLRKFSHPHIIPLVDSVESSQRSGKRVLYLLLPFYSRGSLRGVLNSYLENPSKRPRLYFILRDFRSICEAVNVLHSSDPEYVHQDIKPDNILLTDDNRPVLTDFGSVRRAEIKLFSRNDILKATDEAAQYCTASYRAPELYDPPKGMILDTRTDIWSLGCLLYAWWFGYSPFECQFSGDRPKPVPCSVLRVLSRIPWKAQPTSDDLVILNTSEWMLHKDFPSRPKLGEVLHRLGSLLQDCERDKV